MLRNSEKIVPKILPPNGKCSQRALISFKPHNEKAFHVYEINLDGTGLRQITAGVFDDLDPVYLPDGKNCVFSTSRSYT
jgi:Tol biopolymer transport system component